VITDIGPVTIEVPRDRDGSFEDMTDWLARPLDAIYPVVFIDAIHVKVRDGQVANRAFYVAVGVTVDGKRDILGIWPSNGAEGAKFWLGVLTEIKNRGVADVCIVVCDGLKGLPDAITTTWARAITQTCVLHLLRNTFRLASRADWDRLAKDLRPVYTVINEAQALERFEELCETWCAKYPAIRSLWEAAWSEFVPFLDYEVEIRRVIYSRACTLGCVERPGPGATSPTSRPPSSASTLSCGLSTAASSPPITDNRQRQLHRKSDSPRRSLGPAAWPIRLEGSVLLGLRCRGRGSRPAARPVRVAYRGGDNGQGRRRPVVHSGGS
jgi:putative transposase